VLEEWEEGGELDGDRCLVGIMSGLKACVSVSQTS